MDQIVKSPLVFSAVVFSVAVVIIGGIMASIAGISPDAPMSERYQANAVAAVPSAKTGSDGQHEAWVADAAWVVDPTVPGTSLPPVGRSLFDYLVTREQDGKRIHDVPFPFATLMKRIETQAGYADSGESLLKPVLIPLGRSLQRNAAAPDFFKYPRVVVAVDGESQSGQKPGQKEAPMLLKDRLYLGYQEKANLIEVISYNEAAARFEFQIVKDYRAGENPRVFYANRAVCMSCHQNGAPIFPRQVWGETNANPGIAARLRNERRDFHGIRPDRGVDIPYAIDNATDRANLFPVYQKLWQEGCDVAQGRSKATRCRANFFKAVLQYRLSGDRQYDPRADEYAGAVAAGWHERWPGGLAIPNPDIPNRDPLVGSGSGAEVSAAFDPLLPREPLEIWRVRDKVDWGRAVIGLAQFISVADVRRLDDHLFRRAMRRGAPRLTYQGNCSISRKPGWGRSARVEFSCAAKSGAGSERLNAEGQFELEAGRITTGSVDRLALGGTGELRDLPMDGGEFRRNAKQRDSQLRLARRGLHVRGGDGNTIEGLRLTWTEAGANRVGSQPQADSGKITITVLDDFHPVTEALDDIVREADIVRETDSAKLDAFAAKPFRRAAIMPALFSRLGIESPPWCCLDDLGMSVAELEHVEAPVASTTQLPTDTRFSATRPFYQYCATCHQTPDPSPPNFLAGTPGEVSAKLAQCAERLYVRLSMWQLPAGERAKTPMPPALALAGFGVAPDAWRGGGDLSALRAYVSSVLQSQTGKPPRIDELVGRGYENLRACLPAAG